VSARVSIPPTTSTDPMAASALGHQPETLAAFQRIYGLLWRRGIVSAEIKETARLRNALITDCGF
jgi:hypothetical protein